MDTLDFMIDLFDQVQTDGMSQIFGGNATPQDAKNNGENCLDINQGFSCATINLKGSCAIINQKETCSIINTTSPICSSGG